MDALPSDNVLSKLCREGLDMEPLSWKMEADYPGSSSKVS